jgi:hypothetical protein
VVVGRNDTLVVNAQTDITLPVASYNAGGRRLASHASYAVQSGRALRVIDDSTFRCDSIGDATVRVTSGSAATTAFVRCHPIRMVKMAHEIDLTAGGAAAPIQIGAYGIDGKPVTELGIRATVRDSSIAVIRDGKVYPRRVGRTIIDVDVGCNSWIQVTVYPPKPSSEHLRPDEMFITPIRLLPGEHRFWRVPTGHYQVVIAVTDTATMKPSFSTVSTTCFPNHLFGAGFGCASVTPASFVVRNDAKAGAGREIVGTLSVVRTDSSTLEPLGIYASREVSEEPRICTESPFR